MESAMLGEMQKAKQYAQERERILFIEFKVIIAGDQKSYTVSHNEGQWDCDCDFFLTRGVCSHTMTMERVLDGMLRPEWMTEVKGGTPEKHPLQVGEPHIEDVQGEGKGEMVQEMRTKYEVHQTPTHEEVDESSPGSRLHQMSIELRRLSNQVAEMQTLLTSVFQQTTHVEPPNNGEVKPRELTFREFLGAIWW